MTTVNPTDSTDTFRASLSDAGVPWFVAASIDGLSVAAITCAVTYLPPDHPVVADLRRAVEISELRRAALDER